LGILLVELAAAVPLALALVLVVVTGTFSRQPGASARWFDDVLESL
jgi:hypothetical protein